jgi:hypothetical protein
MVSNDPPPPRAAGAVLCTWWASSLRFDLAHQALQDIAHQPRSPVHQTGLDLDQDSPGIQRPPRVLRPRVPTDSHDRQSAPGKAHDRPHTGTRPLAQQGAAQPAGFHLSKGLESVTCQRGVRGHDAICPRIHDCTHGIFQFRLRKMG